MDNEWYGNAWSVRLDLNPFDGFLVERLIGTGRLDGPAREQARCHELTHRMFIVDQMGALLMRKPGGRLRTAGFRKGVAVLQGILYVQLDAASVDQLTKRGLHASDGNVAGDGAGGSEMLPLALHHRMNSCSIAFGVQGRVTHGRNTRIESGVVRLLRSKKFMWITVDHDEDWTLSSGVRL